MPGTDQCFFIGKGYFFPGLNSRNSRLYSDHTHYADYNHIGFLQGGKLNKAFHSGVNHRRIAIFFALFLSVRCPVLDRFRMKRIISIIT